MSRLFTTSLIAAVALGVATLAVEPASAMPVAGTAALESGMSSPQAEQVRFFRHRGFRRAYGFRRHGFRRGHPIRRMLRAL